jgi:anti-sigma B factor antagonist
MPVSASISDVATSGLPDFSVEQDITADTVIVRVRGDLDHTTITHIDDQLHAATALPTPSALVVLDLSRVSFLGSDGLSLLIANHRQCAMRRCQLRIVATTSAVLRPIALTGLDGILSIASSVHEAIGATM